MKLLNLNIGMKINNASAVVSLIKEFDPDVITLQEVVRHFDDSVVSMYKAYETLREELHYIYPFEFFSPVFTSKKVVEGDETIDFGGLVEQGNMTISKHPIKKAENIFYYKNYCYQIKSENGEKIDEPRAIQNIDIETPYGCIKILHTHGIWTSNKLGDTRTDTATNTWKELIEKSPYPTILVGDLNLLPESPAIQDLNKYFYNVNDAYRLGHTRPKFEDGIDIGGNTVDYVFVNKKVKSINLEILQTTISDHYPLLFKFELP